MTCVRKLKKCHFTSFSLTRAITSLSIWKLSATRAMLLVRLPTISSTSMKEAVMASIPSNRAFDPHPLQLNVLGNFILTNYSQETFPIWNNKCLYFAAALFFLILDSN